MSAPTHYSSKPTDEEERKVREMEGNEKRGPAPQLCVKFFGRPKCSECGRSLQTWKAYSPNREWIVYCSGLHCFRLYFEDGTKRWELIPSTDPRYDWSSAKAAAV